KEAAVRFSFESTRIPVLVGDALHLDVSGVPLIFVDKQATDAAVLVELREHRDQGFGGGEQRVAVGITSQLVLAVEAVEVEVIDVSGCRCRRPQHKTEGDQE